MATRDMKAELEWERKCREALGALLDYEQETIVHISERLAYERLEARLANMHGMQALWGSINEQLLMNWLGEWDGEDDDLETPLFKSCPAIGGSR